MKVLREVQMKTDRLEVGDRIRVQFFNEKHYATAIQQEEDGMLFLLDDCLDEAQPMNAEGGSEGGYEKSDLREYLIKRAGELPAKLRRKMVAFENGDYLSLLTMQEACGVDTDFNDLEGQIEWMKDRRYRVATRKDNEYATWWLRDPVSAVDFALVDSDGGADNISASYPFSIRPAFKIRNP